MERRAYVLALKVFYATYGVLAMIPVLVSIRSAYDALALPPLLLLFYALYAKDKRDAVKR